VPLLFSVGGSHESVTLLVEPGEVPVAATVIENEGSDATVLPSVTAISMLE
jgi:hypothetical protein